MINPGQENKRKIAILEFCDEAEAFLKYCRDNALSVDDFRIIALQPQVRVMLKTSGIDHEDTLVCFPNRAHATALRLSEEWHRFLAGNINIEDGTRLKAAYNDTFLFFARFYISHFLMIVGMLDELAKENSAESIYAVVREKRASPVPVPVPHIQDDERYAGVIARDYCKHHGIGFVQVPESPPGAAEAGSVTVKNPISSAVSSAATALYKYLLRIFIKKEKVVLLTSLGYNFGRLSEELKGKVPQAIWVVMSEKAVSANILIKLGLQLLGMQRKREKAVILPLAGGRSDNVSVSRLSRSIASVLAKLNGEWRARFDASGVNFIDIMIKRFEDNLAPYLMVINSESHVMEDFLDHTDVKLLISPFARFTSFAAGEACLNRNIPALMIAHGPIVKPNNELEEIENYHLGKTLVLSDAYNCAAIQTPSEEEHYIHYRKRNAVKDKRLIRTGPLIFSKIDISKKKALIEELLGPAAAGKKILLYPESVRLRNNMRFHTFQSSDELLATLRDLINVVNVIGGVHLVIRLHPGGAREINPVTIKTLLPATDNMTVISAAMPFGRILTVADLLINFSSTVIEEALQNYIPVLLYDRENRYRHLDSQVLKEGAPKKLDSVYYLDDPGYLKQGLEWILKNHLSPGVPKELFMKHLFTEDLSGNLTEFVRNAVMAVCDGTK